MAGIIEKVAKTPISIKQRTNIVDGKPIWGRNISALAFSMGFQQSDVSTFGTIQNGKIFLVAPFDATVELPAVLECDGVEYDIKAIKPYRNMKGVLLGYRMAVAGA